MGMNTILMLIMGIAMTAIIGSQVAPSMIEQIKATKVEAKSINNQEVIFEAAYIGVFGQQCRSCTGHFCNEIF